jgi:hypothetical protein
MELAAPPAIGPLWVAGIRPPVRRRLVYLQGIGDRSATPAHEIDAHIALLHSDGGGGTFPKIVCGFELSGEKELLYAGSPRGRMAGDDPLGGSRPARGEDRRRVFEDVLGIKAKVVSTKHFLQEEQVPAVADAIAGLAGSA